MAASELHEADIKLGKNGAMFAVLGIIGVVVTFVMGATNIAGTMQSYLFALILFMSLTLGCFGLNMLHHVLQAKWGLGVMRIFEAGGGARNLILMAVLFIPVFIFAKYLYPWARPEQVASDHILHHRAAYLNYPFLIARWVLFFAGWIAYAIFLRRSVKVQEATGKYREQQKRANWASPGLVFLVLSITFAYTDWVMAIDPHWFSTMYGVWFTVGMGLAGLALATLIVCLNAKRAPYTQVVNSGWTRDLGNLLLAFTMLWGYTNLSQYLIIWNGNLPITTTYLINRSLGHWNWLGFSLVMGQFFIPFFALLSPSVKATPRKLAIVAAWILLFRVVDHFHVIQPFYRRDISLTIADITALIGVGGLWAAMFCWNIGRLPLLPTYDPRVLETPEHAH